MWQSEVLRGGADVRLIFTAENDRDAESALSGLLVGVGETTDSHETLRDSRSRENPSTRRL
ncbi:MAG: hypothetical protein DWQ34_08415 [Planctomycetota bacterium]|nr:MAG: hypothetical protein DWQ29_11680 [Planctomycetota bacterium]REJ94490.1 MAG: hypothetical protein DWQ34_08415 [Planctomycetota bacterium]REK26076.1 MAG: hypothetical protein DWQ41_10490 [Planctomycetota bacterium]REK27064.1 MAG: hypothetical protein DWQ45_26405 [Planctomycetota bacterium]